jgi:hypothetical protein
VRTGLTAAAVAALIVLVATAVWYVRRELPRRRARAGSASRRPAETSAPGARPGRAPLVGIPAIRHFFRTNEVPVYFVSATAFNLLGIDRWVRNFRFVNYYDSFDGWHPNVFVPKERGSRAFESIEDICNYLLGHKEVVDYVSGRGPGKVAFLMFDEETEALASELGLDVAFPPAELRHRLDSKIETTRLANEAGVPSVPNVMGRASRFGDVLELASGAGLGDDLVIQTPYGDSGQTTFFVANERDWKATTRPIRGSAAVPTCGPLSRRAARTASARRDSDRPLAESEPLDQ